RDVLLGDGRGERGGGGPAGAAGDAEVVDASGLLVCPRFIDLHAHLREPGREYAETIHTGLAAAAAGGFTAVCAMPNTNPVVDSGPMCEHVRMRAATATGRGARMYPIAAISKGQKGEELSEFGEIRQAGGVGLAGDGKWLADAGVLRRAFEHAGLFELPIVQHCEDRSLSEGAPMHEGAVSTRLGLAGQPAVAEAAAVARDLLVAGLT